MMADEITPEKLAELDALAEQATPGPWVSAPAYGEWPATVVQYKETSPRIVCQEVPGFPLARGDEGFMPDFAFIAAANPAAVLALIERLRVAEEARRILAEHIFALCEGDAPDGCANCNAFDEARQTCKDDDPSDCVLSIQRIAMREARTALGLPEPEVPDGTD